MGVKQPMKAAKHRFSMEAIEKVYCDLGLSKDTSAREQTGKLKPPVAPIPSQQPVADQAPIFMPGLSTNTAKRTDR